MPAKNRDTDFHHWNRPEVHRRFFLTLHPCNLFFVPGVRNRVLGENPAVISFMAERFEERYGLSWKDFLHRAGSHAMSPSCFEDRGRLPVELSRVTDRTVEHTTHRVETRNAAQARYTASRLTFKRDVIEPLADAEAFEVVTPMGVYRFTKRQFYAEFPAIVQTMSYRERGLYHGANLHLKAHRYRTSDS